MDNRPFEWYDVYYTHAAAAGGSDDQLFVHMYAGRDEEEAISEFKDHRGGHYDAIVDVRRHIYWG